MSRIKTRKLLSKKLSTYIEMTPKWVGVIGLSDGTIYPDTDEPQYIYVRDMDGGIHRVYNTRVPALAGYVVVIGFDHTAPKLQQVLSMLNTYRSDQPTLALASHHHTHEWPNYDTVSVDSPSIIPATVRAAGGMVVTTYPFNLRMIDGTWMYIDSQDVDLTSHIPVSGGFWVLLCFSQVDGSLVEVEGTQTPLDMLGTASVPSAPVNHVGIGAVSVFAAQTEVLQTATVNHIRDLRWSQVAPNASGVGDMLKSVYDTDDDGAVEEAAHAVEADNAGTFDTHPLSDFVLDGDAAGGDLAGTYPSPTVAQASKSFRFNGVIAPDQIIADQNDYSPAGIADAVMLRLSSDASHNITGLGGGSAGRIIIIHNVGSFDLVLTDKDVASVATNRFDLTADLTVTPSMAVPIQYDATDAMWRVFGGGGGGAAAEVVDAIIGLTAPFSVSDDTPTAIEWDDEQVDNGEVFDGLYFPTRLTFAIAGQYLIGVNAGLDGDVYATSLQIRLEIWKNGAPYRLLHDAVLSSDATEDAFVSVSALVDAAATDYFEVYITQISGAAIDLSASSVIWAASVTGGGGTGGGTGVAAEIPEALNVYVWESFR